MLPFNRLKAVVQYFPLALPTFFLLVSKTLFQLKYVTLYYNLYAVKDRAKYHANLALKNTTFSMEELLTNASPLFFFFY